MKRLSTILLIGLVAIALSACKKNKGCTDSTASNYDASAKKDDGSCTYPTIVGTPPINNSTNVEGYGILEKLSGIWNGPVYSPTPLGSYPEWIVDFRPISSSQISAKNELDSLNDIFMSFFICKHANEYKVAFRNGGGFAGSTRNAYLIIDSLSESPSQSFYRFVDPAAGANRVYTDVTFKQDSLIMHVYTNQNYALTEPVTHMIWTASLRDATSASDAISLFNFPQKQLTKDFSTTFDGLADAVFYTAAADPYPEEAQPYLGNSTVNISITNPPVIDPSKKVLIIITTQPLFSGLTFIPGNLDFRSRYVFVDANNSAGFNFNYMHPGDYYINTIYDSNGDYNFTSGDYMNGSFDIPFTLTDNGTVNVNATINLLIP
jgi:hypothetical protein